jgi:hypothetical protein
MYRFVVITMDMTTRVPISYWSLEETPSGKGFESKYKKYAPK